MDDPRDPEYYKRDKLPPPSVDPKKVTGAPLPKAPLSTTMTPQKKVGS